MQNQAVTAFTSTEQTLMDLVKCIDVERFRRERIPACSFLGRNCLGMCCSLPVAVTREETEVLTRLVKDKSGAFRKMGLSMRGPVVKIDEITQRRCLAKKRRSFRQLNRIIYNLLTMEKNPPSLNLKVFLNFISTCVFTTNDGACGLQILSEQDGLHKWYYKPINCWKYPLSIDKGYLTLPDNLSKMHLPCTFDKSLYAHEGLKEELLFLGEIIKRDIISEIRSKI